MADIDFNTVDDATKKRWALTLQKEANKNGFLDSFIGEDSLIKIVEPDLKGHELTGIFIDEADEVPCTLSLGTTKTATEVEAHSLQVLQKVQEAINLIEGKAKITNIGFDEKGNVQIEFGEETEEKEEVRKLIL